MTADVLLSKLLAQKLEMLVKLSKFGRSPEAKRLAELERELRAATMAANRMERGAHAPQKAKVAL